MNMADKLFDPESFLVTYHFPYDEFNKRVAELTESITADIAADRIKIPGSVVTADRVKGYIWQMAKDKANEEYDKDRKKSKLAEKQLREYFDLRVAQELEGFPTSLADLITSLAWANGHFSGYHEVFNYIRDYHGRFEDFAVNLVRCYDNIGNVVSNPDEASRVKAMLRDVLAGNANNPVIV